MDGAQDLAQLLDRFRGRLPAIVRQLGRDLLRFESVSDVTQEVELQLLRAASSFVYQGDAAFHGMLQTVTERVIINRRKFWHARRRDVRHVLRISTGPQREEFRGVDPAAPFPTPSSVAARRELYARVVRATALLLERDRNLLTWMSEGRSILETADSLSISYDAAAKARNRAIANLKKAYKIVCNSDLPGTDAPLSEAGQP